MAELQTIEALRILVANNKVHFKAQSERLAELRQSDPGTLSDLDRNAVSDWDRSIVAACDRQLVILEAVGTPTADQRDMKKELNEVITSGDHIIEQKNLFWAELNDRRNAMKKSNAAKPTSSDGAKAGSASTPLQSDSGKTASDAAAKPAPKSTDTSTTSIDPTSPVSSDSHTTTAAGLESDSTGVTRVIDPKQLYKVLQVEPNASLVEIKKAAKKATLRLHPDRNPDDPTATSRFADFQAACQVFDSEEKRQEFDATGDVKAIDDLHLRLEGLLLE